MQIVMTPQEKAKELVDKYFIIIDNSHPLEDILKTAKECALICCNEVLGYMGSDRGYSFWVEVKKEIEKL